VHYASLSFCADERAPAEIFKRANKPDRVAKQEAYNASYRGVVEGMMERARWPSVMDSGAQGQHVEEQLLQEDIKMHTVDLVDQM
jgi:hypothetical protein